MKFIYTLLTAVLCLEAAEVQARICKGGQGFEYYKIEIASREPGYNYPAFVSLERNECIDADYFFSKEGRTFSYFYIFSYMREHVTREQFARDYDRGLPLGSWREHGAAKFRILRCQRAATLQSGEDPCYHN